MTNLISESKPRARKKHRCENCYTSIAKGTTYLRQFCSDGGDVWSFVSHIDCHLLACKVCECWDDGMAPLADLDDRDLICDEHRGHFPHVIARLELATALSNQRYEKSLRAVQ